MPPASGLEADEPCTTAQLKPSALPTRKPDLTNQSAASPAINIRDAARKVTVLKDIHFSNFQSF
jgi:hypothetical protein